MNAIQSAFRLQLKPSRRLPRGIVDSKKKRNKLEEEKALDKSWQRNIYLVSQTQVTGGHTLLTNNDRESSERFSKMYFQFPWMKIMHCTTCLSKTKLRSLSREVLGQM